MPHDPLEPQSAAIEATPAPGRHPSTIWLAAGAPTALFIVLCAGGTGIVLSSLLRGHPILGALGYTPLLALYATAIEIYTFTPLYKLSPEGLAGLNRNLRWQHLKWTDVATMEVTYILVTPHVRIRAGNSTLLVPFSWQPSAPTGRVHSRERVGFCSARFHFWTGRMSGCASEFAGRIGTLSRVRSNPSFKRTRLRRSA